MQTETIKYILRQLNHDVKGLFYKGTHCEFHTSIHRNTSNTCRKHGITMFTWGVRANGQFDTFLEYTFDFIKDNRTSEYSPKGRFSNVVFSLAPNVNPEHTIEQHIAEMKKKQVEEAIKSLEDSIETAKKQLANDIEQLAQMKANFKTT